MYAILFNNPTLRDFLKPYHLSKRRRIVAQVIIYLLILEMVAGALFVLQLYFLSAVTSATVLKHETKVGAATQELVGSLTKSGFDLTLGNKTTRKLFSVPGQTIALHGDAVQVFEYQNEAAALRDATAVAEKFTKATYKSEWKDAVHIYVKGPLVIFYLGESRSIASALKENSELLLTENGKFVAKK